MKIGMLTGIWAIAESATLIESLRRASALGFHYVDLQGVLHAGPAHLSRSDRQAVKKELVNLNLEPRNYVLHAPHNLASTDETELEACFDYLQEGIEMAVDWGINQLMLNAGQWAYGVSRDAAWTKAVHFIQRVCDYAASQDVYIAVESEPYVWFLINDVSSTEQILADVDRPNFTVLIDLGHLALAREGPDDLARLADKIIHGHFSDHEPFQHTNQAVGTGFTRTADYLQRLQDLDIDSKMQRFGYDEIVTSFELGVPGDDIPDADQQVRRSLEHILEIAPYMTLD